MASRCVLPPQCVAIIAILIAAVAVVGGVELTVRPFKNEQYKAIGEAMVLTCELELSDEELENDGDDVEYTIQWFDQKNNREIIDRTGRRYVEHETLIKKLYITDIRASDEGTYRCRGARAGFQADKQVTLKLYKDITFDSAVSPQHPRIFTDALIKCVVSGVPKPEISWRYKGRRMRFGDRYQSVTNGLRIKNVTLADDGEYTCRAEVETDGRYDERKISVAVHIPPELVEGPGQVEGIEGEEEVIRCNASGFPKPTFSFFKDGVLVVETSHVEVNASAGFIRFNPLMKADEHVRYKCTATNDVGSDSEEWQLRVFVRPQIEELRDIERQEFRRAVLRCLSKGDPAPQMTFHKIGRDAPYQTGRNENGHVTVTPTAPGRLELAIDRLLPSDAGQYLCTAVNNMGQHNATANITVLYKPRFADSHVKEVYIWAGKTRNVTCSALSEPAPTFQWTRNGQRLRPNNTFQIFSSGKTSHLQVTVREPDQSWIYDGFYTCVANNTYGMDDIDIKLERASVPDVPKMVNMTVSMPNSVVITVTPPDDNGGMPIVGYRVAYNDVTYDYNTVTVDATGPTYKAPSSVTDHDTQDNEIRIESLSPSTKYRLKVSAKNEVGVSQAFELEVETEKAREPYPIEISSKPEGEHATYYDITWNRPHTGGRPINRYEFKYAELQDSGGDQNADGEKWTLITVDDTPRTPILHYQLENLTPNTRYKLIARAENGLGWSDYSSEFIFRTAPASEAGSRGHLSFGVAAGFVLVAVIVAVLAVITDLSCFFVNRCGITMCICHSLGRSPGPLTSSQSREKALEEGERERLKGNADDDGDEAAEQPMEKMKLEEVENDANNQEQAAVDGSPKTA